MSDVRRVLADCTAWSTNKKGLSDGSGSSRPLWVTADELATVQAVAVDAEPRSLIVTLGSGERVEIRERYLAPAVVAVI